MTGIPPNSPPHFPRLGLISWEIRLWSSTNTGRITPALRATGDPAQPSHHIPRTSVSQREEIVAEEEVRRKSRRIRGQKGSARGEARMEALFPALKSHPGLSVLAFSLIFRGVNHLVQQLPVPKAVKQNDFASWKWKNLSVSMVHSLLTGTWALTW